MKLNLKALLIGLLLVGLLLAGCGQKPQGEQKQVPSPSNESNSSVTITDAVGRTITIDQPVERVAILDNGTAEILKALGVLDQLVGNHLALDNNPLYPELKGVPVVATHSENNFEMLAEVMPQVVFSSVRAHGVVSEQEHLQGFNIQDVKLNLRNPEVIKDEVLLLGKIFDKEAEAQKIVDFYNQYEELIASRIEQVNQEDRLSIFVEYHAGDFKTGAPGSRFYEQTLLAGGINLGLLCRESLR